MHIQPIRDILFNAPITTTANEPNIAKQFSLDLCGGIARLGHLFCAYAVCTLLVQRGVL